MKNVYNPSRFLVALMTVIAIFCWKGSSSQVTEEWVRTYDDSLHGFDRVEDMVADSSGNVYVTGETRSEIFIRGRIRQVSVITTIKYNSKGEQLWSKGIDGIDTGSYDASNIIVDNHGNVYVSGSILTSPEYSASFRYATVKYDSSGVQKWVQYFTLAPLDEAYNNPNAIAVDDAENVYVTGFGGDRTGNHILTLKYNKNGELQWMASFGNNAVGQGIAADKNGNVFVFGPTRVINDEVSYALIKYNQLGEQLWVQYFPNPGANNVGSNNNNIVLDELGNIIVLGQTEGNFCTIKYDKNGNLIWVQNNIPGIAKAIALDKAGNVFIAGISLDTAISRRLRLTTIKYNATGVQQWIKYGIGVEPVAVDIALDSASNVYITGSNGNIFTVKYNQDGELKWVKKYEAPSKKNNAPAAIALDHSANIYVSGYIQVPGNDHDYVTIRYSPSPEKFGVCCFDNGFGPEARCGRDVTPLSCSRSGKDAFFIGYVDDCSVLDTAAICSRTPAIVNLNANYNEKLQTVEISWKRDETPSNAGYYVQRSPDGISFKSIGFMPANTSGNYIFSDPYPEMENYYKLVWFEKKGFESNKVKTVAIGKTDLKLFPNPATNKIRIVINDMQRYDMKVMVTNNAGQIVLDKKIPIGNQSDLDISKLQSGFYTLTVQQNGKTYRDKFVKQ